MNDKNWQTVRELEHGYKRLGLEVIENFLLSIASGRAGDGKGAGLMFAAVVDKLHPLMDAREAYLNAREEVANYAEDLGALSGDQAENAVLTAKNRELISRVKAAETECGVLRARIADLEQFAPAKPEPEPLGFDATADQLDAAADRLEDDASELHDAAYGKYAHARDLRLESAKKRPAKMPVLKLFKVWPAWEAEPEIFDIEATDRRAAAAELANRTKLKTDPDAVEFWAPNRQFQQCSVRDILRVEVCAGEYSREYCVEEVK